MANYHNAVSDKLVVSFFTDAVVYNVFAKDNTLKWSHTSSNNELPNDLEHAIFSNTHCICAVHKFVMVPSEGLDAKDAFQLSYGTSSQLKTELIDHVKLAYQCTGFAEAITSKLVNYKLESDIGIALAYFGKKKHSDAIYFYEYQNTVSIFAYKNGSLVFANSYLVTNTDELFYFVMLAVEQLDLPVEDLYVECISTKGKHESLSVLFKNYLPALHLTPIQWAYNTDSNLDKDIQTLSAFFSQCVL
ncbi:MAG: hypothetical protein RLZZ337_774 [Bacteroidota bacterium]|jgi:hypothetical protein